MQLRKQDNVTYVSIADTTAGVPTSTAGRTDAPVSPLTLAAGGAAMVDEGNIGISTLAAYTALADDTRLRICQNIAGELVFTAAFTKSAITGVSVRQYSAATQQITAIGFNGTAGDLPAIADERFYIKVRKNDNDAANRSQPTSIFSGPVLTVAGTQEELAELLVSSGVMNMADAPGAGYLKMEMLNSAATGTGSAWGSLGNPTGDATFSKGSKTVSMTDTQDLNVGDYVRLADVAATEATTNACYRIAAIPSGTTITLGTKFAGASATISEDDLFSVTAASLGGNYGIKVTGIMNDFDVNAFRNYYSNRFTCSFSDAATAVSHLQGAKEGSGVWQEVAMDEYMSMGNQGENQMLSVPPKMRTQSVVVDGAYDAVSIAVSEDIHGLTSANTEDARILLYVEDGSGSPTGLGIATALGVNGDLT